MSTTDRFTTDVIVVGAGPTGLALAGELALAGVRCRLLERRAGQPNITRAFAVHARTLEMLDARGLADQVLPHGNEVREIAPAPGAIADLGTLPTRYPFILIVPQSGTEKVLEEHALAMKVDIAYGVEAAGFEQDADGVTVRTADGVERARYLVGCDGARSAIRRMAGIGFEGTQYETHIMLADVRLAKPPDVPMFAATTEEGAVLALPFGDGWFRVIAWDRNRENAPLDEPLPVDEMRDAFRRIAGEDFGMGEARWSSRFLSERRQASRYSDGRVFLAGDAAHVHSPLGGQGMNTGIQDAMNLGWKLGAAVHGWAPSWLLDSYGIERHEVGRRVLALTDRFNQLVLGRSRARKVVQRFLIRNILRFSRSRNAILGRLTGIGIAYPRRSREDHPWVGRRMPDVSSAGGRLFELLREGRFVLLTSAGEGPGFVAAGLPAPAVLIRPDGYVAWAGPVAGVEGALRTWYGPEAFADRRDGRGIKT